MLQLDTPNIVRTFFLLKKFVSISKHSCTMDFSCQLVEKSGYSIKTWRKKLLLSGKKWLLGGKKWILAGNKWLLGGKKWLPGGRLLLLSIILQYQHEKIKQKKHNFRKVSTVFRKMSMHIVFMILKCNIYVLADFCDQIPLMSSIRKCCPISLSKSRKRCQFSISKIGKH